MTEFFDTSRSACREHPTEWWYPLKGKESYAISRQAVLICRACPVRSPCLSHALVHETHGIWGGMREAEREIERRRLGIQLSDFAINTMSQQTVRMSRRLNNIEKTREAYR
jgi:WhiB family redox-sensing transcriptional regulator